jgi:hypothetical protein
MPRPRRRASFDDLAYPRYRSGVYYFLHSQGGNGTNNNLGNGTLRLSPFLVPTTVRIVRLCAEFTAAGEAASVLRIGIFNALPNGDPGTVALDAGTISTGTGDAGTVATGGTPGVYEITCDVTLPRGWYHAAGAVQGAPTTQPTIRTVAVAAMPDIIPWGATIPGANSVHVAYNQGSVPGAFSTFAFGSAQGTVVPRIHMKTA